jgi:hypothetical protein
MTENVYRASRSLIGALALMLFLGQMGGCQAREKGTAGKNHAVVGEKRHMNTMSNSEFILNTSRDQRELERTALSLADSARKEEIELVETHLKQGSFLRRLDSVSDPYVKTKRFRNVAQALGRNSASQADKALQTLLHSPDVTADVDRIDILLEAAAMKTPLTEERASLFRIVDARLYTPTNIALLVPNGSPLALAEVKREILHRPLEVTDAAMLNTMRRVFLTHRIETPLIKLAQELAVAHLSRTLEMGLYQAFFDYQPEQWYGPIKNPPVPPGYEKASREALLELLKLAARSEKASLSQTLHTRIQASVGEIESIQARQ